MSFGWLKSFMPRSLFGRAALILLVPILTIQIVVSYVFIQRLYEYVTEQMTRSLLPSITLVLDAVETAETKEAAQTEAGRLARDLGINLTFEGAEQIETKREVFDLSGRIVTRRFMEELPAVRAIDLESNTRRVRMAVETPHGLASVGFQRDRVSASNPHQLLVLMVFVAAIVTVISFLFLRNQVRPIRRLAKAAQAFGKGQVVPYRPTGATEVRQAGSAFLEMRSRIERQIEERTTLLSGVSHDLRTPLTRMKLALSMLPEEAETGELKRDVDDMQKMLDSFLDFARINADEQNEAIVPAAFASRIVSKWKAGGALVELGAIEGDGTVDLNPMAIERALQNLIGNALKYGSKARLSVFVGERTVRFSVEDDGPGIPEERREEAMRPFSRLDAARNQDKGGSVGLGLSIVRDIARQHGGSLRLSDSEELGGLRVDLVLAR